MKYFLVGILVLAVLIAFIFRYRREEKENRIKNLKESFGKPGKEKISYHHFTELKSILNFRNNVLPDSVWDDLNMDAVFEYLNQSVSAIGEEYLYTILHSDVFSAEKLNYRISLARELSDEDISMKLRYRLSYIRKQEHMTVMKCIQSLSSAKRFNTVFHIICLFTFVASFIFAFIYPEYGIFPCIMIAGFNCCVYFGKKSNISGYDEAVRAIVTWLNITDDICSVKYEEKPQLQKLITEMNDLSGKFTSFRRFSWLLAPKSAVGSVADMLLDYVKFVTHLDLIKFNLAVRLLINRQTDLQRLYELTGELELAIIISGIIAMDRQTCIADFSENNKIFISAGKLTHPLLSEPVPNDCITNNNILLTGSNASGKSTYLKMVGVNVVLAQTLGIAFGESYKASFMNIRTSIHISDDLTNGDSFYLAEIKRIKSLIDEVDSGKPVFICIDEILKGTNTIERIAASAAILKYFVCENVIVLAATHDIELTGLLSEQYDNYYFTEDVNNCNIFDYKLRKGVVYTSNAIKLLERYGYPESIINDSYIFMDKEKI